MAVIVPAWNESTLDHTLARVRAHLPHEIIVVHSGDPVTVAALRDAPAYVRQEWAPRGRAWQMNAGAAVAGADVLLFLHADTELPAHAIAAVRRGVEAGALWGFFPVRLAGRHPLFRVIERMMNWRSRITGIATGDQAIFVQRHAFELLGGYAPIALMEDIDLCQRLKWLGRPARLPTPVVTSSRRWETRGIWRTVLLMWWLRGLYALGVSPQRLARWYQ